MLLHGDMNKGIFIYAKLLQLANITGAIVSLDADVLSTAAPLHYKKESPLM